MQHICFIFFLTLYNLIDHSSSIVCYKCDSVTFEACAMALDATDFPYEECKTSLQCTMSVVDSVTYRGCSQTTPTVGATYSKSCSLNLCNKGVYPPGRLKCYHCSDAECIREPSGKPQPCLSHHEDDECYTQVINMENTNRGCRSDANRTATDEQVEYCAINGCNNKPGIRKLKCIQCDSKTDLGCKINLQATTSANCNISQYTICEADIVLTKNESCFLYHNLDRVVRGCTHLLPEDIETDLQHLLKCNHNDLCNAACLQHQKCVVCDSTKNKNCRESASNIPKTTCGSAEVSSCHACETNDWQVKRDCGPKPVNDPKILRCYECSGEQDCNEKTLTRCYKCSTADNANCASWERPQFKVEIKECEEPGASCISATFSNGLILRGCHSSSLSCNDSLINCHECSGSFCNKGRYPPNRLRCYQCQGSDECNQIDEDPLPCLNVSPVYPDACFEYYDIGVGMIRGCRSNALLYYQCIFYNEGKNCRVCYEDGCNDSPALAP